jgi:glycosyltransferase involved in cell wall biosynthesis
MQAGSGMQLKILEAMACSVPVVTTTLGLGDIDADIDQEILVGDNENSFSSKVIELMLDDQLNKKIGTNGKSYLFQNHCRSVISKQFIKKIEE